MTAEMILENWVPVHKLNDSQELWVGPFGEVRVYEHEQIFRAREMTFNGRSEAGREEREHCMRIDWPLMNKMGKVATAVQIQIAFDALHKKLSAIRWQRGVASPKEFGVVEKILAEKL